MDRYLIIRSEFNKEITLSLSEDAKNALCAKGVTEIREISSPGAFELPLMAQKEARTGLWSAIICIGCVIKGETAHFEYICSEVARGIMQVGLDSGVPVIFGVLTVYSRAQAQARARANEKGREAALAAWEMVRWGKTFESQGYDKEATIKRSGAVL